MPDMISEPCGVFVVDKPAGLTLWAGCEGFTAQSA